MGSFILGFVVAILVSAICAAYLFKKLIENIK